jgi:hypothetical protein
VAAYVPAGWPTGVHPPGSKEFEQTAVAWLLDVVPPDYRLHGVLRRHPVALAALARHHLAACVAGAREGYRTARAELGHDLPPGSLDAVLDAYRTEGSRLVETARAVDLVGRALRGEVFAPQLAGTQDEGRSAANRRGGSSQRPRGGKRADANQPTDAKQAASAKHATGAKQPTDAKRPASAKQPASARQRAARPREATSARER